MSTKVSLRGSPQKVRLEKGLFADGIWMCNCQPRLPANHLQTKKPSNNQGRWFYTCQVQEPDERCKFFLWADDAKAREASAVLSNSRTEPQTPKRMHTSATFRSPPTYEPLAKSLTISSTRSRLSPSIDSSATIMSRGLGSTDFGDTLNWSDDEDNEMPAKASGAPSAKSTFETPRKALKTSQISTPGGRSNDRRVSSLIQGPNSPSPMTRGLWRDQDIQATPSSETPKASRYRDFLFETPSKPKAHPAIVEYPLLSPPTTVSTNISPTKSQISAPPTPSSRAQTLTNDIFDVINEANLKLGPKISESLRQICERYKRYALGLEKGREATRKRLHDTEVKLTNIRQRNAALEAEQEVHVREIARLRVMERRVRERGYREGTGDSETTQATSANKDGQEFDDV